MKYNLTILFLSLFLLLIATTGTAPCASSATPEKLNLRFFIAYADMPPYFIENPEHQYSGILVDVLKALTEPLGYTFTIKRLPDKRGWDMLENREVDIYASTREWVSQPDKFLWTDSFMLSEDVLLYPVLSPLDYTRQEDLYGRTVAGIKGFVYPVLEPHFGPGKIERLDTTSAYVMLKILTLGRADAALVNRTEIQWIFRTQTDIQPEQFRLDESPIDTAYYRFLFPKDQRWEPVINQFNLRLKEMKEDGSLKAILDQYRQQPEPPERHRCTTIKSSRNTGTC